LTDTDPYARHRPPALRPQIPAQPSLCLRKRVRGSPKQGTQSS
jgi:hypothetical protein